MISKDWNGQSDPYVVLKFGTETHKTTVVNKSLNPLWNQEFEFTVTALNIKEQLVLTVWDKDKLKSDESMGTLKFVVTDLMSRLVNEGKKHWYPLAPQHPKQQVSGDICIQAGVLERVDRVLMELGVDSTHTMADVIETDDPADGKCFDGRLVF